MQRVILIRHPGFIDRFVVCPFGDARKPLNWSTNWFCSHIEQAFRFGEEVEPEAERYRKALDKGYEVLVCKPITRTVQDYEVCK